MFLCLRVFISVRIQIVIAFLKALLCPVVHLGEKIILPVKSISNHNFEFCQGMIRDSFLSSQSPYPTLFRNVSIRILLSELFHFFLITPIYNGVSFIISLQYLPVNVFGHLMILYLHESIDITLIRIIIIIISMIQIKDVITRSLVANGSSIDESAGRRNTFLFLE